MKSIAVTGKERKVEVLVDNSDNVNEHTLRGAFQLENDVRIGLSMMIDERKIYLRYFLLLKFKISNIAYNLAEKK